MKLVTEVQNYSTFAGLPPIDCYQQWSDCVLIVQDANKKSGEFPNALPMESDFQRQLPANERQVVIRFVDDEEMQQLNGRWRGKHNVTNVLAFPAGDMPGVDNYPMGDIVICAGVVQSEATEQGKLFIDRLAHIFIHGLLHLLGFDHLNPEQALEMEKMEEEVLSRLGYAKPYE